MEFQGYVRGFGSYTKEQMEQVKRDLGVRMSLSALLYCASYYRNAERRDPLIEELLLLDRLVGQRDASLTSIAPTELFTNNDFVARTYADLMEKRRATNPDAALPLSLAEALNTATAYLARSGKPARRSRALPILEDKAVHYSSGAAKNCLSPVDSRFQLRLLHTGDSEPLAGDWLVLLCRGANQKEAQFDRNSASLLCDERVSAGLVNVRTVDRCGLLCAVLSLADSACLDLAYLSRTGEDVPLRLLSSGYEGTRLLRISGNSSKALRQVADELGLCVLVFGCVTDDDRLCIRRSSALSFSLSSSFVRSLFFIKGATVKLWDEDVCAPLCISPAASIAVKHPYLAEEQSAFAKAGELLSRGATTMPERSFFKNALYAALCPVLSLAADGCDYPDQRLSVGLQIPNPPLCDGTVGEILSTVLGLYRLQAELGIPTASLSIIDDSPVDHPALTVFASGRANGAKDFFEGVGNSVSLVLPEIDNDGLPSFSALRRLLTQIFQWKQSGILVSARVLCNESVTDAVRRMEKNGRYCYIQNHVLVCQEALPLALLVESTAPIDATRVGEVRERDKVVSDIPLLPTRERHLVWSERPRVALIAASRDTAVLSVAALMADTGAEVSLLYPDEMPSGPLSSAILSSSAAVFFGRVTLPGCEEIRFALDTMRRAGGIRIGVGKVTEQVDVIFKDGLNAENIARICQKN